MGPPYTTKPESTLPHWVFKTLSDIDRSYFKIAIGQFIKFFNIDPLSPGKIEDRWKQVIPFITINNEKYAEVDPAEAAYTQSVFAALRNQLVAIKTRPTEVKNTLDEVKSVTLVDLRSKTPECQYSLIVKVIDSKKNMAPPKEKPAQTPIIAPQSIVADAVKIPASEEIKQEEKVAERDGLKKRV